MKNGNKIAPLSGVTVVLLSLNRVLFRKYFDNPDAVDKSKMKPCNETNFANDNMMSTYLQFTGDTAGVQILPDGKKVGICPDDYFFIMPACRSNSSRCIIYITGGLGYGTTTMSQKAVRWNMPLALGVAKDWTQYGTVPGEYKSVFYWFLSEKLWRRKFQLKLETHCLSKETYNCSLNRLKLIENCLPFVL